MLYLHKQRSVELIEAEMDYINSVMKLHQEEAKKLKKKIGLLRKELIYNLSERE